MTAEHRAARKETEVAGSGPTQSELVNGLPFGGNATPAPALVGGLPFADPNHPVEPVHDAVLPFAQPAATKPAVQPPPRVLTPPPGFVMSSPDIAATPADAPATHPTGTVEVSAPVQSANLDSVIPPGFAPVAKPSVVTPTASEPPPPTVDSPSDLEAQPAAEESPWKHEPVVAPAETSEVDRASAPPPIEKKSSKMPLLIGLVVVLLGGVGAVGFVFRDKLFPPDQPPTAKAKPTATATASAAATVAVAAPSKPTAEPTTETTAAAPTATAAPTEVASAAPSATSTAATATAAPTQVGAQPTPPPVHQPQVYPPYHPPAGNTNPGGKFDPGGI